MLYVKIDRATGAEMERRDLTDPSRAFNKPSVWLPLTVAATPGFNPNTHKTVRTRTLPSGLSDLAVPVSPSATVADDFTVVALVAAELADVKQAKIAALDQGMVRGVDDLVALAKAAGWPVPQALLDKTNARRALRGAPPL